MSKNSNKKKASNSSKRGKQGDLNGRRELIFKEDGQEYAKIVRAFGDGRFQLACGDKRVRSGKVCGKMRNKVWVKLDDIVLVGLRDFDEETCDIIHKYFDTESAQLADYGEIQSRFLGSAIGASGLAEEQDDEEADEVFTFDRIQAI